MRATLEWRTGPQGKISPVVFRAGGNRIAPGSSIFGQGTHPKKLILRQQQFNFFFRQFMVIRCAGIPVFAIESHCDLMPFAREFCSGNDLAISAARDVPSPSASVKFNFDPGGHVSRFETTCIGLHNEHQLRLATGANSKNDVADSNCIQCLLSF